jgi:hypothetical protein
MVRIEKIRPTSTLYYMESASMLRSQTARMERVPTTKLTGLEISTFR